VETREEKIIYSKGSHIADDLDSKTGSDFATGYMQVAVINPNAEKHLETVLDTNYASMLRKFTLELEKENSVLFIFGFSLKDKHIRELLYGVMKNNPTLIVVYLYHKEYDEVTDELEEKKKTNFYVENNLPFEKSTEFLSGIFVNKEQEVSEPNEDDEQL
jgi:hypothetical protein